MEEAAQVTIDIYLKMWAQMIKKKNLKVWVHPVLPLPQVKKKSFLSFFLFFFFNFHADSKNCSNFQHLAPKNDRFIPKPQHYFP